MPDNLKASVLKADRNDPRLNRSYAEMAEHYGTAVLSARPRKLRDKAQVEVVVLVVQRWIVVSQTRPRHDARLRRQAHGYLCHSGSAASPALAGRALYLSTVKERAGSARLSCRG